MGPRMSRRFHHDISRSPRRVKIAGVVCAGALALLALDAALELQPTPAPRAPVARIAAPAEASNVHSVAYYPEQLAVLNSLSSFRPEADAGVAAEPSVAAVKPATPALVPGESKAGRRADAAGKPLVRAAAPAATSSAMAAPDNSARIFGIAVPGSAALADGASSLRDAAMGLGGKVAGLWR